MLQQNNTINTRGGGSISIRANNGRVVGRVKNKTYYRTWKNKHVCKFCNGLAIDACILDRLQELGVESIEARNVETGKTLRCTLSHFLAKSTPFDFGHGEQRALSLNGWTHKTVRQMDMFGDS